MTQSTILGLAKAYKNSRNYRVYELLKFKAQKLNLTANEYEVFITKLAKVLGV